jgi:hypothetical protein
LSIIDCHFGFSIVYLVPNVHKIFSSRHQRTFNQSINQSNRNVLWLYGVVKTAYVH